MGDIKILCVVLQSQLNEVSGEKKLGQLLKKMAARFKKEVEGSRIWKNVFSK